MMKATWNRAAQPVSLNLGRAQILEAGFWLAAVLLGAAQAWACRFQPSTIDLVSYLDVGDAYLQGHWHGALNGYWNPLYSWVLGVCMAVVRPLPPDEYPLAKLVDFGIYLSSLLSFRWFLKMCGPCTGEPRRRSRRISRRFQIGCGLRAATRCSSGRR